MKSLKIYLIGFVLLSGCVTQQKCLQKFPPQSDSIHIETVTMVPYPVKGDTIQVSAPVNCPDQDILQIENSKMKQVIRILNGKLLASTEIKPDTIRMQVTSIREKIKEVIVTQPVRYVPQFYKWCRNFSIIIIIIIILYLVWKFKLKISLFK